MIWDATTGCGYLPRKCRIGTFLSLAVEPIVRADGDAKNDCERNATKRLLRRLRSQHPKLKILIVEDGLASNAPHVAELKAAGMSFLLGVKPGDHKHLFEQVIEQMEHDNHLTETYQVVSGKQTIRTETNYIAAVSLNKSHADLQVHFLQHYEFKTPKDAVVTRFS